MLNNTSTTAVAVTLSDVGAPVGLQKTLNHLRSLDKASNLHVYGKQALKGRV